jgi:tetratricopeptide (TPR) repeat protein
MLAARQLPAFDFAMVKETPIAAENPRLTKRCDLSLGVLLFVVTFIVYLPALRGGFIWDDDWHVTKPELRSLHGLWRIWSEVGATAQYYPLLHSAFWVEYRWWGDDVMGYHLANILLHAGAACLVVAIMRRLALPGAWLAGFIFALHPVCVESVAWISEQKNTLSAVFYLGAALVYLRFDQQRRWPQYFLATGLFALALLSKTVTATLPAALLVVFWWQRGRLSWKREVLPLVPWFVLGAGGGLFTAWVERRLIGAEGADFQLTLLGRGLLAGRVGWFYLGKLVWPTDLIFIYPHWTVSPALWWQYLFPLGVMVLAVGLWLWARRCRGPLAAFLFFLGTLFPVLGFLNVYPFIFSYVADHFQYLACLGIIVPVAAGLTMAASKIPAGGRWLAPVLAGALLLTLGVLTSRQAGMYRDTQAVYEETLARNPDCWMAHNNLGCVLETIPGRLPDAIGQFETAVRIKPDYAQAFCNLGRALAQIPGRLPEAVSAFETALRIKPDYEIAHSHLGSALANLPGRLPEAISHLEAAIQIKPDDGTAHYNLGLALNACGRTSEAIAQFEQAVRFSPDDAEAHYNLGTSLGQAGRMPEAIAELEAAVRLKPDYAEAHNNLGLALYEAGRMPEARAQCEEVLRINPDFAGARAFLEKLQEPAK